MTTVQSRSGSLRITVAKDCSGAYQTVQEAIVKSMKKDLTLRLENGKNQVATK
ncbi:hypothetical protein [Bacillus sp. OTU530]|uniref:hypothetical protein n=1 Tax=Bacillus sp. OTU530 TaxID=3043862 RepID=UPI00313ECCDD